MMTQSLAFARFYEATKQAGAAPKLAANWLMGEVSRRLNAEAKDIESCPISPSLLAALISRIEDGTVSHNGAKQVLDLLWMTGGKGKFLAPSGSANVSASINVVEAPESVSATANIAQIDEIIVVKGLRQMSDAGALEAIVDEVLAANARSVEEFRAGKEKAFNALVGQVMKASRGKANPAQAGELLRRKLAG
jgi:aspartyl-tRNA(Asn)/glutamyl-tRNA(Gln) amidotransferase subunit B